MGSGSRYQSRSPRAGTPASWRSRRPSPSRSPQKLEKWKSAAGANAQVGTFEEAAAFGDCVVLAVKGSAAAFKKTRLKFWVIMLAAPFLKLALRVFKRQCNTLAMVASKPESLWPWLRRENDQIVFDQGYARRHFKVDNPPT